MTVAPMWIEAHCVVPDGIRKGQPFQLYAYQYQYIDAFYTVKGDATWDPVNPVLAPAFVYRRGLLVAPQKVGKNPLIAAQCCLEGLGPSLFGGWAGRDDGWSCRAHGCGCGWEFPYEPGEPMGMVRSQSLIQVTAFSEEATDNTYDKLRPMVEKGPLADLVVRVGERFMRLPNDGRIEAVTSSHQSRLGNPVTFAPQDEMGLWWKSNGMMALADTQYRGLSGMSGRASLTSNAWDPAQHSVAQREYESAAIDIYRQFVQPPKNLSYANKADRRKIHRIVYPRDTLRPNGGHVDLDAIEAEAADLVTKDPAQAARFYGDMLVAGAGRVWEVEDWDCLATVKPYVVQKNAVIVLGFDGSKSGDHTALIATEVLTGYQWVLGVWDPRDYRNDAGQPEVPRAKVDQAVADAFAEYSVWRFYVDPPYWKDELASWQGRYGDKVVMPWETYRGRPMAMAIRSFSTAMADHALSHSGDPRLSEAVGNCYRNPITTRDDRGEPLWILQKETPDSVHKIDAAMAAILSWEARTAAIAAGAGQPAAVRYVTASDLDAYYGSTTPEPEPVPAGA